MREIGRTSSARNCGPAHKRTHPTGINEDMTILEPRLVTPQLAHKDSVRLVAASRFTSILLTYRNHVYTCGLNAHNQLGYDADVQTTFRRVRFAGQKCVSDVREFVVRSFCYPLSIHLLG